MMPSLRVAHGTLCCTLMLFVGCASRPAAAPAVAPAPDEDAALIAAVQTFASEQARADAFSGVVLLAKDGRPLLHAAYGLADRERNVANTTATRFNIASVGKMFTGVAVAQLVEEGKLDYDAAIGTYMPDLPNPAIREKVTMHHLLTHTSGIPDLPEEIFDNPPAQLAGYLPFFTAARLEFEPGTQRSYSNSGYVLAGMIVERVSGEPYRERIRRRIFERAGMRAASFTPNGAAMHYGRGKGSEHVATRVDSSRHDGGPHGGTYMTAADLVRFFEALRGGRLVTPESALTATTPRRGAVGAYGFGTIRFDRDRLVGHSGGDAGISADAYVYWQSGYTLVVLSNLAPPAAHQVALHARKLLEPRFRTSPAAEPH